MVNTLLVLLIRQSSICLVSGIANLLKTLYISVILLKVFISVSQQISCSAVCFQVKYFIIAGFL